MSLSEAQPENSGSFMLYLGPNKEFFSTILAKGLFNQAEIDQYWADLDAGKLGAEQIWGGLIRIVAADLSEGERTPSGVWNSIVQSVRARNKSSTELPPQP